MTEPIRVLQVIKGLGRGGAETLLVEGHDYLRARGFESSYAYFLPHKDALVSELRARGAHVECLDVPGTVGMLRTPSRLGRLVRRGRPHLLHAHLPLAGVATRLAGRRRGVPVVYTEHNLQRRYHPVTAWLNARTWRMQSRVIAVSGEVRQSILDNIGAGGDVEVVRNGVNLEHFDSSIVDGAGVRSGLAIPESSPVLGTVAVFRTQKRLDLWLRCARTILDAVPTAHFLLIGDGPLHDDVQRWRAQLGLEERVHLPGLLEDVRPHLAAMTLYLMSSDFEGLPVALLEAMAMGLPAVATSVGGIPEVVNPSVGAVVLPGQPDALAAEAVRLLGDEEHRVGMGRAARSRVEDRFGMDRMADELVAVYRAALVGADG